jgi:hypothetical protein
MRDLSLVYRILRYLDEFKPEREEYPIDAVYWDDAATLAHLRLLMGEGMVQCGRTPMPKNVRTEWLSLTVRGHTLLADIKNERLWQSVITDAGPDLHRLSLLELSNRVFRKKSETGGAK